ncbi:hypothetical protein HDV01_004877 [Terramyces sp. JEL0728]|nr:hypothetical protein HDV01_004877 [Terramyces sp. JEL0728]
MSRDQRPSWEVDIIRNLNAKVKVIQILIKDKNNALSDLRQWVNEPRSLGRLSESGWESLLTSYITFIEKEREQLKQKVKANNRPAINHIALVIGIFKDIVVLASQELPIVLNSKILKFIVQTLNMNQDEKLITAPFTKCLVAMCSQRVFRERLDVKEWHLIVDYCMDFFLKESEIQPTFDRADRRTECLDLATCFSAIVGATFANSVITEANELLTFVSQYISLYQIENLSFEQLLNTSIKILLFLDIDNLDLSFAFLKAIFHRLIDLYSSKNDNLRLAILRIFKIYIAIGNQRDVEEEGPNFLKNCQRLINLMASLEKQPPIIPLGHISLLDESISNHHACSDSTVLSWTYITLMAELCFLEIRNPNEFNSQNTPDPTERPRKKSKVDKGAFLTRLLNSGDNQIPSEKLQDLVDFFTSIESCVLNNQGSKCLAKLLSHPSVLDRNMYQKVVDTLFNSLQPSSAHSSNVPFHEFMISTMNYLFFADAEPQRDTQMILEEKRLFDWEFQKLYERLLFVSGTNGDLLTQCLYKETDTPVIVQQDGKERLIALLKEKIDGYIGILDTILNDEQRFLCSLTIAQTIQCLPNAVDIAERSRGEFNLLSAHPINASIDSGSFQHLDLLQSISKKNTTQKSLLWPFNEDLTLQVLLQLIDIKDDSNLSPTDSQFSDFISDRKASHKLNLFEITNYGKNINFEELSNFDKKINVLVRSLRTLEKSTFKFTEFRDIFKEYLTIMIESKEFEMNCIIFGKYCKEMMEIFEFVCIKFLAFSFQKVRDDFDILSLKSSCEKLLNYLISNYELYPTPIKLDISRLLIALAMNPRLKVIANTCNPVPTFLESVRFDVFEYKFQLAVELLPILFKYASSSQCRKVVDSVKKYVVTAETNDIQNISNSLIYGSILRAMGSVDEDVIVSLLQLAADQPSFDTIPFLFEKISKEFGFRSVLDLLEIYLDTMLHNWTLDINEFPMYLFNCETLDDFTKRYAEHIALYYFKNSHFEQILKMADIIPISELLKKTINGEEFLRKLVELDSKVFLDVVLENIVAITFNQLKMAHGMEACDPKLLPELLQNGLHSIGVQIINKPGTNNIQQILSGLEYLHGADLENLNGKLSLYTLYQLVHRMNVYLSRQSFVDKQLSIIKNGYTILVLIAKKLITHPLVYQTIMQNLLKYVGIPKLTNPICQLVNYLTNLCVSQGDYASLTQHAISNVSTLSSYCYLSDGNKDMIVDSIEKIVTGSTNYLDPLQAESTVNLLLVGLDPEMECFKSLFEKFNVKITSVSVLVNWVTLLDCNSFVSKSPFLRLSKALDLQENMDFIKEFNKHDSLISNLKSIVQSNNPTLQDIKPIAAGAFAKILNYFRTDSYHEDHFEYRTPDSECYIGCKVALERLYDYIFNPDLDTVKCCYSVLSSIGSLAEAQDVFGELEDKIKSHLNLFQSETPIPISLKNEYPNIDDRSIWKSSGKTKEEWVIIFTNSLLNSFDYPGFFLCLSPMFKVQPQYAIVMLPYLVHYILNTELQKAPKQSKLMIREILSNDIKEFFIEAQEDDIVAKSILLDVVMQQEAYDQDWMNLFSFQDALHQIQNPGFYSEDLIESLSKSGHYQTVNQLMTNRKLNDDQLDSFGCMWRLGQWSTDIAGKDSAIGQNINSDFYQLLYQLEHSSNIPKLHQDIDTALVSYSNSKTSFPDLISILEIKEIVRFKEQKEETNVNELFNIWTNRINNLLLDNKFEEIEQILSIRTRVMDILLHGKEKLKPNSAAFGSLQLQFKNHLYKVAELAIDNKFLVLARNSELQLENMQSVSLMDSIKTKILSIKIEWARDHKNVALKFFDNLLNTTIDNNQIEPSLKGEMLHLHGMWSKSSRKSTPKTIVKNFLQPALKKIESSKMVDSGKYYFDLANYCDEIFNTMQNDDTHTRSVKLLQRRKSDLDEMQRLGENAKKSNYIRKLTKQIEIDEHDISQYELEKDRFLLLSVQSYMRNLAKSDLKKEHSVFRLCSLWFSNSTNLELNSFIEGNFAQIATNKFLILMHQLSARFAVKNLAPDFFAAISSLIETIVIDYPYQALSYILALKNVASEKSTQSTSSISSDTIDTFISKIRKEPNMERIVFNMEKLFKGYILAAYQLVPKNSKKLTLDSTSILLKIKAEAKIPVITVQQNTLLPKAYDNIIYIDRFENTFNMPGGINAPKVLKCVASDGKIYRQLVKSRDSVLSSVFNVVNMLLSKQIESRKRKLYIRTYKIVPLAAQAGVLEWVDGTVPIGNLLMQNHPNPKIVEELSRFRTVMKSEHDKKGSTIESKLKVFKKIEKAFPPIFGSVFFELYRDPKIWYENRLKYVQSVAASSIVGYMLGIGDRHCQNILFDKNSAEVIHIDLGIAFDQGKLLTTPELVPFRLTKNLVHAMGITGVEGVFKRGCEETLKVLHTESDFIFTLLDVFRHDPLYSWSVSAHKLKNIQKDEQDDDADYQRYFDKENSGNEEADIALFGVRKKLSSNLGVECQIEELVNSATDANNLCRMYPGWQSWI